MSLCTSTTGMTLLDYFGRMFSAACLSNSVTNVARRRQCMQWSRTASKATMQKMTAVTGERSSTVRTPVLEYYNVHDIHPSSVTMVIRVRAQVRAYSSTYTCTYRGTYITTPPMAVIPCTPPLDLGESCGGGGGGAHVFFCRGVVTGGSRPCWRC